MALLDGCTIHGVTQEEALNRWNHPQVQASSGVQLCACCDGPALGYVVEMEGFPGGIGLPVVCTRCRELTSEDKASIVARLNEGYPIPALSYQVRQ